MAQGLENPVYVTSPPGDESRLFIVEQGGRIRILASGALGSEPFLDIREQVSSGGERGLLSMAFHPDYAANGHFFVYFTDLAGDTRVVRYTVSADPNIADSGSASLVLALDQPYSNHNGGLLLFGPDGYLYIGLGDGGAGGDPHNNGQNPATLLGSLLRVDVDGAQPYRIPPDNPFAGRSDGRPEIWAYGFRNLWRYSFDRETGELYTADVGQNAWEEVNVVPGSTPGLNYGWNLMEASHCFREEICLAPGLTLPVHEYSHEEGCAITGGFVYRGSELPELRGTYFYSDFCAGRVRSFRYSGGVVTEHRDWSEEWGTLPTVASFGEDAGGELYVVSLTGSIFRISR